MQIKFGDYRKNEQIYSKWRNINKVVMDFKVVFSLVKQKWKSGANDETILQKSLTLYGSQKGGEFQISACVEYSEDVKKNGKTWKFPKRSQVVLLK